MEPRSKNGTNHLGWPKEWQAFRVGDKFVFSAKPAGLRLQNRGKVAFIPMELIPTNSLHASDFRLKRPDEIASGTYFEEGDLLLPKITPCFENGKQGIAAGIPGGFGVASTEVIPIKAIAHVSDVSFLAYYLLDTEVREALASKMEGTTGRQRLSKSTLQEWVMPFPPLPEQRAIAAVLSKIQAAIEVQQKIVATLKELKAATMGKLFREGTRGERLKVTEIGEMPESWEVVKLETVARISTGTTPATDDPSNYDGDIPFIKTAEIDNNILSTGRQCISREAMKRYSLKLYPSQTVFLAMYGQGKTRGRVSLLGISATTTQNTAAIESGDDLDSLYLWHYLLGQYERLRNTGNLGHLSHLNLGYVKSLEIPLPSKNEQGQLGSVLSSLHSKIEVEEQKAGRLQTLFSSMLNLLMTGQVRVNGLNLEDVSQ